MSPRPAALRYYFDADVKGLGKVVAGLRPDATYPDAPGGTVQGRTRPASDIPTDAPDTIWLPVVAARGWLAITRDAHIRRRPAELAMVREHEARLFVLAGADAVGTWQQLELLMLHWRRIEALEDRPGPFILLAARSGVRDMDLDRP